jgi:hypothetical protein
MIYIIRNNRQYGLYDVQVLQQYVKDGKFLKQDTAYDATNKSHIISVVFLSNQKHMSLIVDP